MTPPRCWTARGPLVLAVLTGLAGPVPASVAAADDWVARSDAGAQALLQVMSRFAPEQAQMFGVNGLDREIADLRPGVAARHGAACKAARERLQAQLAGERDPRVRRDLEILIHNATLQLRETELNERLCLPYFDVSEAVFGGLRVLLDDEVAPTRRSAAVMRLRRYAGLEPGYAPFAKLAEQRTRERLGVPGLRPPFRGEVERDLSQSAAYLDGIGELFARYRISGYEEPLAALRRQIAAYDRFVRATVLPRASSDFRLPRELYAFSLEQSGVDMPVAELTSRARVAFEEIRGQMRALAPRVAHERGLASGDYRDVIRDLKRRGWTGDSLLAHYRARVHDVEEIIRRERIVTLPERPMRVELATAAETAAIPAPHLMPPRLIGNRGEEGTFVLPAPAAGSDSAGEAGDFDFEAASWTLTAHEGRPGHELQFSKMVEGGVSLARGVFAINSVNLEGWALYAESEMQPHEPLDGQLIALQHRLLRAARAFLDPGLQMGTVTRDEALRVLREDVVLSEAMAAQEVERYAYWAPGQAPSYFVGYVRLLEIRAQAERAMGPRFDRTRFNDFVLSQGALPPLLLEKAVLEQFVAAEKMSTGTTRP